MSCAALCARIATEFGLVERETWEQELTRAASELAQKRGCGVEQVVAAALQRNEELHELAGQLTVAETHFFRHPEHFDFLSEHLLGLSARLAGMRPVRIWSAGCASGEEPYTIVMALDAAAGQQVLHHLELVATDMSPASLRRARQGFFRAWSFRGTPAWAITRYFAGHPSRGCQISDQIRAKVRFELNDLERYAKQQLSASVDVILFRNVAIYLTAQRLAALYSEFRRILQPEGVLLVSPTDPQPAPGLYLPMARDLFTVLRAASARAPAATVRSASPAPSTRQVIAGSSPPERASARRPARRRSVSQRPEHGVAQENGPGARGADLAQRAKEAGDRGELDVALRHATAWLELEPSSAEGLTVRGQVQFAAQRLDAAVEDLRKALFLDPTQPVTRFWYAQALAASGAHARALRQLDELERLLTATPVAVGGHPGEAAQLDLRAAVAHLRGALA